MSTPTPKSADITFTADEARVLLELINAAVKSLGMNAAKAAVVLSDKINNAFQEPDPKSNVVQQLS